MIELCDRGLERYCTAMPQEPLTIALAENSNAAHAGFHSRRCKGEGMKQPPDFRGLTWATAPFPPTLMLAAVEYVKVS